MNDLEFLREMFKDTRLHVGIGTLVQLSLTTDGTVLYAMVNLLPENRQVVATVGFSDIGDVGFPQINDLAVVVFADGHPDECFVIKLIHTSDQGIPAFARTGNRTVYPRTGKKLYLGSTTKVGIGRPNIEPAEPLVLGTTLIAGLTALCNAFLNATALGDSAMGAVFLDPAVRTAITDFMSTYLTTSATNIASQIGFTERGV